MFDLVVKTAQAMQHLQSLDGEPAVAIPGNGSGGVPIVEYNSPPTGDAMVYCGSFDGQGFTKQSGIGRQMTDEGCHTRQDFYRGSYYNIQGGSGEGEGDEEAEEGAA